MNLFMEYASRNRILPDFFEVPCSLFVEDKENQKIVLAFHSILSTSTIMLRTWTFPQLEATKSLPLFQDQQIPKEKFLESVPDGFSPLEYIFVPIHGSLNRTSQPMKEHIYSSYFDSLLNNNQHEWDKEAWLWDAFLQSYGIDVPCPDFLPRDLGLRDAQMTVQHTMRRFWQYWTMWKIHMLNVNKGTVAGELVFQREATSSSVSS